MVTGVIPAAPHSSDLGDRRAVLSGNSSLFTPRFVLTGMAIRRIPFRFGYEWNLPDSHV